jgi:hypothetical protein
MRDPDAKPTLRELQEYFARSHESQRKIAAGSAFQTVIQLNHLGIRVFCAPEADAAYLRPDLMLIRAYPPLRFSTDNFAYESLDQFPANLLAFAGRPQ